MKRLIVPLVLFLFLVFVSAYVAFVIPRFVGLLFIAWATLGLGTQIAQSRKLRKVACDNAKAKKKDP